MTIYKPRVLLEAVGSAPDRVCSIGAFVRQEYQAFRRQGHKVGLLVPGSTDYTSAPIQAHSSERVFSDDAVTHVLIHTPSIADRARPWSVLVNALKLKKRFKNARHIQVVHEYTEAPHHWRLRQRMLLGLADGFIVNTKQEYEALSALSDRPCLYTKLGPTIYSHEWLDAANKPVPPGGASVTSSNLEATVIKALAATRHCLTEKYEIDFSKPTYVYQGLITPGKGIELILELSKTLPVDSQWILIGGQGIRRKDANYASHILAEGRRILGGRFHYYENLPDEIYQQFLLAAHVLVLLYDNGVSERRSSFLSSAASGGHILTTLGPYSAAMSLEHSGAVTAEIGHFAALKSQLANMGTDSEVVAVARRVKNLQWASNQSWPMRVQAITRFLDTNF